MAPPNKHLEIITEELNSRLNSTEYSLSINIYEKYPPRLRVYKNKQEICQVIIPNRIVKKVGDIIFYNQKEYTEELNKLREVFLEIFKLKRKHNSIFYHPQDYASMAWDIIHQDNPIDKFNYRQWSAEYFSQNQNPSS